VHFYTKCVKLTTGKGKAIPVQAWTGPGGYMRLRLPYFKIKPTTTKA
jgi:hypothetical protein